MAELDSSYVRLNHNDLRNYIAEVFVRSGVRREDADVTADNLVAADIRGVETHGVQRLQQYVGRLRKGFTNTRAKITIVNETPATALVDGGGGLGQPTSKFAMELCLRKAAETGGAFVAVRNSNHFGIAGYYAMMALPRQMIGLTFTNAGPHVAPTYGKLKMIGTNPIALAVPSDRERPFVLDMATSAVAAGKLEMALRKGTRIPMGWAVDSDGRPTIEPSRWAAGGALMPLGGVAETAGYKGYGLGIMVDILCGVLSGAAWGKHNTSLSAQVPSNTGHFFIAIRPDVFRPLGDFKAAMDTMIGELKGSAKAEGESRIYVAGEKEFEREDDARRNGVPVYHKVVEEIRGIGAELGVEWIG